FRPLIRPPPTSPPFPYTTLFRSAFPGLNVGLARPLRFVRQVGKEELHRLAHTAAVGQLESPEILVGGREELGERGHVIELKDRIAVRLGPAKLRRETAVGGYLLGNEDLFELPAALGQFRFVDGESRKRGDLEP